MSSTVPHLQAALPEATSPGLGQFHHGDSGAEPGSDVEAARRSGGRIPESHAAEDALYEHGGIDQRDHAHRAAAVGAELRVGL
ncbi:MAG TPA: hypothetical protein PLU30_26185 [Verrucomicrobiae bacterium]|nr:hypothetical protein [Verrucomicrobiae bacterium]